MTRGPIIAWMTLLGIAQAAAPVAPRYPQLSNPLVQGYLATPQSASWLAGRPLAFQPGGTQPGSAEESQTIAVLDLVGQGISASEALTLTQRLSSELVKSGLISVVERNQMQQILEEQNFQLTGCTTDECVVEIGQLLGVSTMVAGTIGKVGNTYTLDVRTINVESGKITSSVTRDYEGQIDGLLQEISRLVEDLVHELLPGQAVTLGGTAPPADLGPVDVNSPNYRYPGRAMVLSLAAPGAGQLYVGRPLKAVLYLGVEVAAIVTWDRYRKLGDSKTQAFKASADEHWDFRVWLTTFTLYQTGQWGTEDGQVYVGPEGTHHLEFFVDLDDDGLPEIFGNTAADAEWISFHVRNNTDTSAHIYVIRNNEYYENIGKYNQFFSGWDDANTSSVIEDRASGLIAITGNRTLYLQLRTETNQLKSIASYAVSALMFNHVISAVDAIFTSSRWNSAHARRLSGRLWFDPALAYGVGGLRVSLAW